MMKNRRKPAQTRKRSYKELLSLLLLGILSSVVVFFITFQFVSPKPPEAITITSGQKGGGYYSSAYKYSNALIKHNIDLQVIESSGSRQNIERLLNNQADVALVQGGTVFKGEKLYSLGSLYYEPLLIFYKKDLAINFLSDLKGYAVAIGKEGSGTQLLASKLLETNNINSSNTKIISANAVQAVKQLINGDIDVAFFVTSIHSDTISPLFSNNKLKLFNFKRSDAYMQIYPYLTAVKLHQGIISFKKNIPKESVTLLAPTANLVVRDDFNESLSILLLQALKKIHGKTDYFSPPEFFPNYQTSALPVKEDTKRFYKDGPPFLMKYLPFWVASFLDRMIVLIIPLMVLIIPLFKFLPPVYRWRIRSKIYNWYTELQKVDDYMLGRSLNEDECKILNKTLDNVSIQASKVETPLAYVDQLYNLQVHIDLLRNRIKSKKIP